MAASSFLPAPEPETENWVKARKFFSYYLMGAEGSMSRFFAFLKNGSGVIIATVNAIGSNLNAKFDFISTQLK